MRIFTTLLLIIVALFSTASIGQTQSATPLIFSPPLGYRDNYTYGAPYYADYGIKNPFLNGIRCFGVDWSKLYHAGEDWFRIGENGENIPIPGTEVTAVADGTVIWAQPINYPGRVVIISHTGSLLPQTTYSVYSHLAEPLNVQIGNAVVRGQRLGTVLDQLDNSHLHWEIRYFADGSNIYPNYPACNSPYAAGVGYTYPEHPDNFPSPTTGYTDPFTFTTNHAGVFLPHLMRFEDTYEPNDSFATATPINTGVWYESFISSTSDNDWYSFSVTVPSGSARNIEVYLQSIPPGTNYTLELRSPSNQLLSSSTQPSNNDEFIRYYTTSSGTYRARIYSVSGSSYSDSYRLKVDVVQAPTQ
ncbi:MAG: M23 family peptidase [Chloroflexi bacterium]|nr:MAG: M23 family peptidase [Chloroflexota bacterium]